LIRLESKTQTEKGQVDLSRGGAINVAFEAVKCCYAKEALLFFLREYMRLYIQHEAQVDWKSTWFFLYIEQELFPMLRLHS
jgi:hypothetical protein